MLLLHKRILIFYMQENVSKKEKIFEINNSNNSAQMILFDNTE